MRDKNGESKNCTEKSLNYLGNDRNNLEQNLRKGFNEQIVWSLPKLTSEKNGEKQYWQLRKTRSKKLREIEIVYIKQNSLQEPSTFFKFYFKVIINAFCKKFNLAHIEPFSELHKRYTLSLCVHN